MSYEIRRAAVIGAGTMGGGIAAHLANIGIPVYLLDIAPRELTPDEEAQGFTLESPQVRNRIVTAGWQAVMKSRPAALYTKENVSLVTLGNLEENFDWLGEVDYIVEVIIENLQIKQDLMARIEEVRKPECILATNTSGLPINDIAEGRSDVFKQHFLGMHFFNPPRYLKLLEIIPHKDTLPEVIDAMTRFAEDELGKGVVMCKDTPNFIGNRIFSIANSYELIYALENGLSVEEVDSLTGPLIGRPKTGTFRLLDLVGIDVMGHVGSNLYELIPDDESRDMLVDDRVSSIVSTMIENKWLGNKTQQGFYKRVEKDGKKEFWVLNLETLEHDPPTKVRFDSVGQHRKVQPLGARIKAMTEADDRAGKYIRHILFNLMAYASRRVPEIAEAFTAIDHALKWGFAHEIGPFEIWDALGVAETAENMEAEGFVVADWVKDMLVGGFETFYQYEKGVVVGYYDPGSNAYVTFEEKQKEIKVDVLKARDCEVEANADASIIDMGDGIALFEIHTKSNTLTPGVVEIGNRAIDMLWNGEFNGLVIGNDGKLFCGGANLDLMGIQQEAQNRGITPAEVIDDLVNSFQQMMLGMRYAPRPVVTAPFQMALGGGAELTMCGDRVVAHAELYIGQVEVGVGLVPAATGCKELLRRVVNPVMQVKNSDPLPAMTKVFEAVGLAQVATSAAEAREYGFLNAKDRIIVNRDALLFEAKREALHMYESGYRPPQPEKIYAAGRDILAAMRTQLFLMQDAGWASEHDVFIGEKIAYILCGGDLSGPDWVDEQYILDLERAAFIELIQHPKSVERVMHMLTKGKPLRN